MRRAWSEEESVADRLWVCSRSWLSQLGAFLILWDPISASSAPRPAGRNGVAIEPSWVPAAWSFVLLQNLPWDQNSTGSAPWPLLAMLCCRVPREGCARGQGACGQGCARGQDCARPPGLSSSSSGSPGCAGGAWQDVAAGGVTGDSLVPTWQDSAGPWAGCTAGVWC